MNLSHEPFFHILGYDTEHTGYGIHTKEFLNVLRKHKKDFLFTDITHIKTYADREKLKTKLSQKQNVYNIVISYGSECYNIVKDYEGLKIGWTVWESTIIPDNWKDELNKLDQVWIPSKWGKNILIMNGVDKDKIKVVPEGVNTEVFKRLERRPDNNITKLKGFKFLNIGKYEGRKNTDLLIRAFDEEFNKEEDVFLFLQCHNAFIPNFNMNQILDSMNLKNREKIYVISPLKNHNDLSVIYNSCDCFVYPTRAEGWGLPLIEALSCGMNTIACSNGGQSEYLYSHEQEIYIDLKYTMIDITRKDFGNFMFHANSANNNNNNMGQWAEIDINELKTKMRYVFANNNNNNNININTIAMKHIHKYWSWDKLLENENLCTNNTNNTIIEKNITNKVNGINYIIYNKNDIIQKTLINGFQWNNEMIDIIKYYINKKKLIHFLNVGSHIGSICLPISLCINKVTAIEAYPPTYNYLCENIKLNNIKNVYPYNIAVGNSEENIYFISEEKKCPIENINRVNNNTGGMHVFTEKDINNNIRSSRLTDKKIVGKMNKLDHLKIDYFDIMLVDIEGCEYEFLLGAKEQICKYKPIIIIEIWDDNKRRYENMSTTQNEIICYIENLNYKLIKKIGDDYIFEPI